MNLNTIYNRFWIYYVSGIVMNSFSSTLTYNNFDFVSMLTKKQNKKIYKSELKYQINKRYTNYVEEDFNYVKT